MTDEASDPKPGGPGPLARIVLYGIPILMAVCVFAGVNQYWPFTSAELFSRARTDQQKTNEMYAVLADGSTVGPILGPVELFHTPDLRASEISPGLCRRWIETAEAETGATVLSVLSKRVTYRVFRGDDGAGKEAVAEAVRWECGR